MNGSTGDKTFSMSEKPNRRDAVMTLGRAENMLPLVRLIVEDAVNAQRHIDTLRPEQDRLDRQRRALAWPDRRRRYQVREELTRYERALLDARAELDNLGVVLIDAHAGRVGFPTIVNTRRAYFSWKPGQDCLLHWHYADDHTFRPIPVEWRAAEEPALQPKH